MTDPTSKLPHSILRDGRLREIPRKPALRAVVLEWLASLFEPGRTYTEPEVNAILKERHDDHAALRRYLVDASLLHRTDDGRTYHRAT